MRAVTRDSLSTLVPSAPPQIAYIPGKSTGDRWLNSSDSRLKTKIRERGLSIASIEYRELQLDDFAATGFRDDQYGFLLQYREKGDDLIIEETPYYSLLEASTRKPDKMARIQRSMPHMSAENARITWVRRRLHSFIELLSTIETKGWDFGAASYVSTIQFPAEERYLSGVFARRHVKAVLSGEMIPHRVIDGHHRLTCLRLLEAEIVPTMAHILAPNEE
jgi:hypothetical protein